jgi:glycosyltransferase involved in cell wall biosynthesis
MNNISIILPSYNTIDYTKMAITSLRKYYPGVEIVVMDDGSTDGSKDYLQTLAEQDKNLKLWFNNTGNILGHCITYDRGIDMAKNPIVTIFHSDMICGENYLENMAKHLKPKTVVCATRIEPDGIYPPGKEKILKNFGMIHSEFKQAEFDTFVKLQQSLNKDKTTNGIFAPWMIYKTDFQAIGGHDASSFAPYPEEDADLFLRFALAGYTLIQSWDSFCWHWISRGHRSWAKNGVGKDDNMFQFYQTRARRNYLRKWNRWMAFDADHHPVGFPVYRLGFVLSNVVSTDFLHAIEIWAQHIYVDNMVCAERYIATEQPTTKIDLHQRIYNHGYIDEVKDDVLLYFKEDEFMKNIAENMNIIQNLNGMITDSAESNADMEFGIFRLKTLTIKDYSNTLIRV